jgi:hypothetical protein
MALPPTRIAFGSPLARWCYSPPQGGGYTFLFTFNYLPLAGRSIQRSVAKLDRVGG